MTTHPSIDVVIPTFNGLNLLKQNLPSLFKFAPGQLNKVIIVDNGSTDDTKSYLDQNYKSIVYLKNNSNLGFSKAVNRGMSVSSADYVVLLNNDVGVEKDFLVEPLKLMEKDKNLFAVNFNETESSWPLVSWSKGKMQFTRSEKKDKMYFTAWASGGSSMVRRSAYNQLGGLNEVFSPGYWEDIDLGWRAWKAGWSIIWTPNSLVTHNHESTSKLFDKKYLSDLKQSNELVFTWLNFPELNYRISHFINLLGYTIAHPGYLRIVFLALGKYVMTAKYKQEGLSATSIFQKINKPYAI